MIIRQLNQEQYHIFTEALLSKAQGSPLEASFAVKLAINGAEYEVKLQPEQHCRIAALQAVRVHRERDRQDYELITSNALLSSFLEILIYQGIA